MYIASLTGAVMASRLPVISADAIEPRSPGRSARMRASMLSRRPWTAAAYLQPQAGSGRRRRCRRLDRAQHEAGRADALEIKIAGEVVAAGAQRFERRAEAGAERDVGADQGRGALLDRDADPVELLRQPGGLDRLHPHHDAVGALALLADLDEARDGDVAGRPRQHRMRHPHGGERRDRKARRDRGARRAQPETRWAGAARATAMAQQTAASPEPAHQAGSWPAVK